MRAHSQEQDFPPHHIRDSLFANLEQLGGQVAVDVVAQIELGETFGASPISRYEQAPERQSGTSAGLPLAAQQQPSPA
jgi:hypothetical protein